MWGTLIAWGAGIIAVIAIGAAANSMARHHYNDPLIAIQKERDASFGKTIDAQKGTIYEQSNSLNRVTQAGLECTGSLARMQEVAKARGDEADKLHVILGIERAKRQPTIDRDAATAAGPPTGGTCEAKLKRIEELGDEYARFVFGLTP